MTVKNWQYTSSNFFTNKLSQKIDTSNKTSNFDKQACTNCQRPLYAHGFYKKSFICTCKSHITFFPLKNCECAGKNVQACIF
jgi:hypothetical protein